MHICKYLAWLRALIFILYTLSHKIDWICMFNIFSDIDNILLNIISHLIFNQNFNEIVIV
jgi:hypothetical protein